VKKTLFVFVLLVGLLLSACSPMSAEYMVAVANPEYLYEPLEQTYTPGETVAVKVALRVTNTTYHLLVNGERIKPTDADPSYLTFTFTMPAKMVILEVVEIPVPIPTLP